MLQRVIAEAIRYMVLRSCMFEVREMRCAFCRKLYDNTQAEKAYNAILPVS